MHDRPWEMYHRSRYIFFPAVPETLTPPTMPSHAPNLAHNLARLALLLPCLMWDFKNISTDVYRTAHWFSFCFVYVVQQLQTTRLAYIRKTPPSELSLLQTRTVYNSPCLLSNLFQGFRRDQAMFDTRQFVLLSRRTFMIAYPDLSPALRRQANETGVRNPSFSFDFLWESSFESITGLCT